MNIPLMSIRFGIDPDMFSIGSLLLTWHGFFTFISVALALYLVGRWSKKEGLDPDAIYSAAAWAIIGGILGARLVHVIDLWNEVYKHDFIRVFQVWEGGIAIYGAVLGGFVGGAAYIVIRNHPRFLRLWSALFRGSKLGLAPLPSVGRLADITAPAMLIGMALGRVGDIINGEHVAKTTDLAWGFVYSHAASPSNAVHGLAASHPAIVYEMIWDMVVLAIIWPMRDRLRPHGMVFTLFLCLYALGSFFIRFLRTGPLPMDQEWAIGLNEAQFISLVILAVTIPMLMLKAQVVKPTPVTKAGGAGARKKG